MTTFLYKGYDVNGGLTFGSCSFNDRTEVFKHLDFLKIVEYEIFESKTPYKKNPYSLVSAKELSIFCKQVSVMFFSYINIIDGVLLLSEQTDNKILQTAFVEIYEFLNQGYTLSDAISFYPHIFGSYLIQMTKIGEKSGNIDVVFNDLSLYFDKENEIRRRLKSAVLYPVALSFVTILIFFYLIKTVLPMFDEILKSLDANTNAVTSFIMLASRFMNENLGIIIFCTLALIGGIYLYSKSDNGRYRIDRLKIKLPYSSYITNRVITARFSRSLSLLLKSGFDIVEALEQSIILIDNKYMSDSFVEAIEKIKMGQSLADSLKDVDIFPSLFVKMVTIGEQTGNLDEMLLKTTEVYEEEAYEAITRTTKLIEPILITILTIIMGIVLLAIMTPMITIMNAM